jgi:hypothetical protein
LRHLNTFENETGLPNLKEWVLGVLGCEPTPGSVPNAVAKWDTLYLEAAIGNAKVCCEWSNQTLSGWHIQIHMG